MHGWQSFKNLFFCATIQILNHATHVRQDHEQLPGLMKFTSGLGQSLRMSEKDLSSHKEQISKLES